MATKTRKQGRKKGSRNRGYFFRTGRGWCASEGSRAVPLCYEDGTRIREKNAPAALVQEAYARYLLGRTVEPQTREESEQATLFQVCQLYLEHCKATGAASTYSGRADTLFDFCVGLPPAFQDRDGTGKQWTKKEKEAARIHKGYGGLTVGELKPLHVDRWLAAHPDWKGGRRTKIQALKRALNYGVESGFIQKNPIKGYKVAKSRQRRTYLTPEQEKACYRYAKPALATAIKVCIRTGARFGCEFARLTAKHVEMTPKGMEWRFQPDESKTKRLRIVRITDPAIIEIVERQIEQHPTGPLFRNTLGNPWARDSLSDAFRRLRKRLARNGIELDEDACMYSTRHTYAKRTLSGYWTGKPTTIEQLAELMGNTREVCWEHYASWCDAYTDPLWESA